jgi:hypothetical protein
MKTYSQFIVEAEAIVISIEEEYRNLVQNVEGIIKLVGA